MVSPRASAKGCSKAGTEEGAVGVLGCDRLGIGASAVGEAGQVRWPGSRAGSEDITMSPDIEGREEKKKAGFWLGKPAQQILPLLE